MRTRLQSISSLALLLGTILVFSLAIRLYQLHSIPGSFTHDEIYYLVESQSLAQSLHDPYGGIAPWLLKPSNALFGELPGLTMVIGALLFPQDPVLAGRITHVVIGTLLPFVLGYICWKLFQKKSLAVIVVLLASFNPWVFQNSRMAFDAIFSVFFYLCGIAFFLNKTPRSLLLSFVFLSLGFYEYQGLKLLYPLIIVGLLYYHVQPASFSFKTIRHTFRDRSLVAFAISSAIFFLLFLIRLSSLSSAGRVNDLIFFNTDLLANQVNTLRQTSLPHPFLTLVVNKYTQMLSLFSYKYLDSFDLKQLFLTVDIQRNPTALWSRGIFHLIDLPLILLGLFALLTHKKWRFQMLFLMFFISISPLPSAINSKDTWMFFRSCFLFPWLIVLSALGFNTILNQKKLWLTGLCVTLYILNTSLFFFDYFVRYPMYTSGSPYNSERVLMSYIARVNAGGVRVTVLTSETFFTFANYVALSNAFDHFPAGVIHQAFFDKQYQLGNVNFDSDCLRIDSFENQIIIAEAQVPLCENAQFPPEINKLSLISPIDSGADFVIVNDPLCQEYQLGSYSRIVENVFAPEKLSRESFCRSFFANQ